MKKTLRAIAAGLLIALLLPAVGALAQEDTSESYKPTQQQEKLTEVKGKALLSSKGNEKTYVSHYGGAYIEGNIVVLLTQKPKAEEWKNFQKDALVKIVQCKYALNELNAQAKRIEALFEKKGMEWISTARTDSGGSTSGDYAISVEEGEPQWINLLLIDQDIGDIGNLLCRNRFDMGMIKFSASYRATVKTSAIVYERTDNGPGKKLFKLKKGETVYLGNRWGEWLEASTGSGKSGYVKNVDLEVPSMPGIL